MANPTSVTKRNADTTGANPPEANQSQNYELSEMVLLWDSVELDSALNEKYMSQLASGGTLLYETSAFPPQKFT